MTLEFRDAIRITDTYYRYFAKPGITNPVPLFLRDACETTRTALRRGTICFPDTARPLIDDEASMEGGACAPGGIGGTKP